MSAAVDPEIVLLTDLPCVAGARIIQRVPLTTDVDLERSFDGRHRLTVKASLFERDPDDPKRSRQVEWVTQAVARTAWHIRLPNGQRFDWLTARRRRRLGRESLVEITADPAEVVLSDCGPIYTLTPGGLPDFTVRWDNKTFSQVWTAVLQPFLRDIIGYTWISLGTVDPTLQTSYEANEPTTPAEVVGIWEQATGATKTFDRNGNSGYTLGLQSNPAAAVPRARLREGVNVVDVLSLEDREDLATGIIPRGQAIGGVRALAGYALWEVTNLEEVEL